MSTGLNMTMDVKNDDIQKLISNYPKGKRAIALIQLSKYKNAEEELRRLYHKLPDQEHLGLMAFAEKNGLPGLAMRIAGLLKRKRPPALLC